MKLIGLTGSIGMGKTEVAKILRSQNIPVFDSDAEVHALYNSVAGVNLISPLIPKATLEGFVDRKIIAEHILQDASLLPKLEKLVHAEIKNRRQIFRNTQKSKLVVFDMPLLFEIGAEQEVHATIVVSSSAELQKARVMQRPGMTEEKFNLILKRQMPDAERRKKADFIIENNGSLEDLHKATLDVIAKL